MRGRRGGRFGKAAGFISDDGLGPGESPGRGHEPARIADRFDVEENGLGLFVLAQVVDQIGETDIDGVPDGDEMGEPQLLLDGPVQDGRAEGSRLGDESDLPGLGHGPGEAGVQLLPGHDDPQAVRPDQPH